MDLLDTIAAVSGCPYLSDLNHRQLRHRFPPLLLLHIERIPAEQFPFDQWQRAAQYMTGDPCEQLTPAACKAALLCRLRKIYIV